MGVRTRAQGGKARQLKPLVPTPHSINDNAALGRVTSKPDVTSEELEATPMQVEQLGSDREPFNAVRVAAGDSVSLAISDRGELRAWGSFRVSPRLGRSHRIER